MLSKRLVGVVVGIVGLVVGVVSVLADVLGITGDPNSFDLDKFGWLQIVGTVLGIVVLIAGIAAYRFGDRLLGWWQSRGSKATSQG